MIPFPNIEPEIFSISLWSFEFALRWYALSYVAGFICASYLMTFFLKREYLWKFRTAPMEFAQVSDLLTWLIVGVILGGRLGYVAFYNLPLYISDPFSILKIWQGGMSFHGGFLGVIIATALYARRHGVPLIMLGDLLAIASPPGLMFGRIANFVNAELWGRPTTMPWGVIFPGQMAQNCPDGIGPCARHPSQLYEASMEGFLLFLVILLAVYLGGLKKPGFVSGIFLVGYGSARFFVEYFRVPDPQFFSLENPYGFAINMGYYGFTMGQLLSLPMIAVGAYFIFKRRV